MKIALHQGYGAYSLSELALDTYACLNNNTYCEWWDIDRNDPLLIQVIEMLGEAASDGTLYIVDIPAGTRYYIHEYDGAERIVTEADIKWSIAT